MTKNINELIKNRFSPRAFSNKEVSEEQIKTLLKAATLAASSYNEQPWRFIYAAKSNNTAFNKILDCVMEFNLPWAKNAAGFIICVVKDNLSLNDKPNSHAWHDMGLAIGNLSVQAQSMDIYLRQIGGFYAEKTKEVLNIPDGYTPISAIALGYLGEITDLSEELQKRENTPKEFKPFEELIFNGEWK